MATVKIKAADVLTECADLLADIELALSDGGLEKGAVQAGTWKSYRKLCRDAAKRARKAVDALENNEI